MSRGLQFLVFLVAWLFIVPVSDMSGQGREGDDEKFTPPILFGLGGTINDLDSEYCSDIAAIEVYANDEDLSPDTDEFLWYVYTYVGGSIQWHDDWFTSIGSKPDNGISIDPSLMDGYYGKTIYVEYRPVENGTLKDAVTDRIYVYKTANTTYSFGPDFNVCHESPSQDIVLENSEDGYDYYLYKDGVQQSGMVPEGSDGTPIHFPINFDEVGTFEYTVEARRSESSGGLECPVFMDESAEVTVNPLPDVSASTSTPEICEGETIFLEGGPDDMESYYWEGPNGFTSDEPNPEIPDATLDYTGTYTLTVQDANTCEDSESVDVTVNENPSANPDNDGPACEGGSINLSANPSGGSGSYTFEWTKTGDGSFSETTESFTFDPVSLSDAGEYNVTVTDDNGCQMETTESTVVDVNENPVVSDVTDDGPVCEGGTLILTADVSGGSGNYSYSWTGPDGFSSAEESPVIENITLAQEGDYELTVTDDAGCTSNTESTTVTVNELPSPVASNDGPKCEGSDIQLTGEPDGMSDYSWSGPNGYSSNEQTPLLASVDLSMAGDYTLTVTDGNGCENSDVTTVEVDDLQEVELNNDGPVCEDGSVTFEATVTGGSGDFSYYWEKDGVEISGVNTSTYTINDASLSDAGDYEVFVTDESSTCGTVSATSSLVVNENPVIDDIDNDGPACEGDDVQLSVSASGGSGNYSYSWTGPEDFSSDEQNPVVSDVTTANAGDYEVVITDDNTGCSSATETTTVEVNENPDVDVSSNSAVCEGEDLEISASPSGGSGSYSYKWYHDGTEISETSSSFTISGADMDDAGTYEVEVTDDGTGCVTTQSTDVEVNENPTVSLSDDMEVCEGEDATFNATASDGDGNYVYTWYFEGTEISGADESSYTVTDAQTTDEGLYEVVVSDGNGCDSDVDGAQLTVNENPTVTINGEEDPDDMDVCFGDALSLEANATGGSGSFSYEWELPDNSTQTGAQLDIDPVDADHDGIFTVTVTDDVTGCTGTEDIRVNVIEVDAQLSATASTICENDEVTFTAESGQEYEFFHYKASSGSWSSVKGPESDDQWTFDAFEDGDQVYARVIDDLGCEANTDTIEMTVYENPEVELSFPDGNEVCENSELTVEATEGYANYIFYVNGTEVQDRSDNIYTSDSFSDGDEIYVTASTGTDCSADSDTETITVHPLPTAEAGNSGAVCEGFDITLQGGPDGMDGYEWFGPDDEPLSTSRDHDLTNVSLDDAGVYTLIVTDGNGCQNTDDTDVEVYEEPAVDLGDDIEACEGTNVELEAVVTGGSEPYEYYWENDGSEIDGVSTSSYTINEVDFSDEGTYSVTVTDANGCVSASASVDLTVNESPVVSFDEANSETEVCEDESIVIEADASGGDASDYTYEWYHDGDLIAGVSTRSYTINNSDLSDEGTYEVIAIDGSGCASAPDDIEVIVHPLPDATLDMDPEYFIEGQSVEFTGGGGEEYAFYINETEQQPRETDNSFETSDLQDEDSVSVRVYSEFGCRADAWEIVSVFEDFTPPELEITNQEYCENGEASTVEVTNPFNGVTYEVVYENDDPTSYDPIVYDGSVSVSWDNVLDENGPDGTDYRVKAYWEDVPDDYKLSGSFEIIEYEAPDVFPMTVDGNVIGDERIEACSDGDGYEIGLEDSWGDDTYVLFLNGDSIDNKDGGPSPLNFGNYSIIGEYTIMGYNDHCQTQMEGRFILEGDDLEIFELSATDDGKYCEGGDGVDIDLSGSEDGIEYVLYRDDEEVATETGDGNAINFGQFSQEGTYYAEAESSNGCIYRMENVVEVKEVSRPDPGTLTTTDEGEYCEGGEGVKLQLSGQEDGHTYYLIYDGDVVASHVGDASGDDVNFINDATGLDLFTATGDYHVIAETNDLGCQSDPGNTVTIETNPLPENRDILGEFGFCPDASTNLYIENSQDNVEYQLYDVVDDAPVLSEGGNGSTLSFPVSDESSYTIFATNTETGCERNFEDTVDVLEYDAPDQTLEVSVQYVSVSDDPCADEEAVVSIDSPEQGVTYYLWKEGNNSPMSSVEVTESGLSDVEFPDAIRDNDGDYYVTAIGSSGCEVRLDEELDDVSTAGAMTVYALDADDNLCQGDGATTISTTGSDDDVEYSLKYASNDDDYDSQNGDGTPIDFVPDVSSDSYFYLEADDGNGCKMVMDSIHIKFNPLPKAFEMSGSGIFCDSDGGTQVGLNGSEFGVDYYLIEENEGQRDKIEGSYNGDSIEFNEVVTDGTFTVFAKNQTTGCTSSMKDTIKVTKKDSPPEPEVLDDNYTIISCGSEYDEIVVTNPQDGVKYDLVSTLDPEEELMSVTWQDKDENLRFSPVSTGEYFVIASWYDACPVFSEPVTVDVGVEPVVEEPIEFDSYVCNNEEIEIKAAYDDRFDYELLYDDQNAVDVDYTIENSEDSDSIVWKFNEGAGSYQYYIEVIDGEGFCNSEQSSYMNIEVAEAVDKPVIQNIDNDTVWFCPEDHAANVMVESGNPDWFYFLSNQNSKEGRSGNNIIFENSLEDSYELWASDQNGCTSDTVSFDIAPYFDKEEVMFLFEDFIADDIDMDEAGIPFVLFGEDSYTFNIHSQFLNDEFEHFIVNEDSLTSYPVNENEVEVFETGTYRMWGRMENTGCDSLEFSFNVMNVKSDEIVAHPVYFFLNSGENTASDTINVDYGPVDEGKLEYHFIVHEGLILEEFNITPDSSIVEYLSGDYTIHPDSGYIEFEKGLSFNGGNSDIIYEVRNREIPSRFDRDTIHVYAGNKDINEDKSIFIPNAFSPNDDGVNERFEISVDDRSETKESTLEVYNRWGNIVYRSKGKRYDNSWDGTANVSTMVSIGDKLPNGVYFYVYTIRANVEGKIVNKKFNGYVELRR